MRRYRQTKAARTAIYHSGFSGTVLFRAVRIFGYSLIEILIVMVILAIGAMIAQPMITSASGVQLRSATDVIAADLEYAKSQAITTGQYFSVVFDESTESYCIKNEAGTIIPHPVKKGFDYIVNFKNESRLNKVNILSVNFDSTNVVKFDYLGSPYNGNDTPLTNGVINLQAGDSSSMVTVEAVTGFILVTN